MSVEATGSPSSPPPPPPAAVAKAAPDASTGQGVRAFDDDDGPSFSDLLDVINPLQHIPIVSTIYRELTGDDEGAVADVVGGVLFGGVFGLAAATFDIMTEAGTGKRIGENVVAWFQDDQPATAVAQAQPATTTAATGAKTQDSGAPPPPAAAPRASVDTVPLASLTGNTGSGPVRAGDYLVFGASQTTPPDKGAAASPRPSRPAAARTSSDGPARAGDFLVFGAIGTDQPAGNAAAPTSASATAATPAETTQAPSRRADTTGRNGAIASRNGQQRVWAVPDRTGPTTARQTLPPPTTGPGALPGGHSVAVTQAAADSSENMQWFANAFNQAMDKYQRAQRLGDGATAGTAAGTGDTQLH